MMTLTRGLPVALTSGVSAATLRDPMDPATATPLPGTPAAIGLGGVHLVVEGVTKVFKHGGRTLSVLKGINFELRPGEIVGVVGRIRHDGLDAETRPQVYWNYKQRAQDRMALVVRTGGDPANWAAPVIAQIRALDPDQPVYNVFTMEDIVDRSLSQRRLNAVLVAVFAGVSLLLAAIGIYGVVAYSVQQRVREFGIRLALGANRRDVTRIVVLRAAAIACIGSVLGLGAAAALGRFLQTMLFEVSATDAVSYASAAAVLIAVAVIASYVPVRRALAMDPMQSLRAD